MEIQSEKMMSWIEHTDEWQLFETKITCSASKDQFSKTFVVVCLFVYLLIIFSVKAEFDAMPHKYSRIVYV